MADRIINVMKTSRTVANLEDALCEYEFIANALCSLVAVNHLNREWIVFSSDLPRQYEFF